MDVTSFGHLSHLDHITCYGEGGGWESAEPYVWTVFFNADGSSLRLDDTAHLAGSRTIYGTPGSHGHLGDTDVDAGDDAGRGERVSGAAAGGGSGRRDGSSSAPIADPGGPARARGPRVRPPRSQA